MKKNIIKIDFKHLMPHIRFIHKDFGNSENWIVPKRVLYDYEMIYLIKGKIEIKTSKKSYLLTDGSLHIMSPFVEHKRTIPKGEFAHYFSVHFDLFYRGPSEDFSALDIYSKPCAERLEEAVPIPRLMKRRVYKLSNIDFPEIHTPVKPHLYIEEFNNLLEHFNTKRKGYEIFLMSSLLKIIGMLVQEMDIDFSVINSNKYEQVIAQCMQYIHDNYSEKLDFSKIASSFGFSPGYFRQTFKKVVKMTPLDYQIKLRIDKAKDLLINSENSISEISYAVGYDDVHYFSRLFKNKEKISPKTFRENAISRNLLLKEANDS